MSEKLHIFISHSSTDKELAIQLKNDLYTFCDGIVKRMTLEKENIWKTIDLDFELKIFISSESNAIATGTNWQSFVLDSLDKSDVFIPIITLNSVTSQWVWFEIGYFWKKKSGQDIFPCHQNMSEIPSPLNTLQSKLISDKDEKYAWYEDILMRLITMRQNS